jgi:hypothetical protein
VPWSPGFVSGLPPRGGFRKKSKWPWDMIYLMPRMNLCRLYIYLAFTYSVGLSSGVWSRDLDRLHLFHQWECLKRNGRGLSISRICDVALSIRTHTHTTKLEISMSIPIGNSHNIGSCVCASLICSRCISLDVGHDHNMDVLVFLYVLYLVVQCATMWCGLGVPEACLPASRFPLHRQPVDGNIITHAK